MENVKWVVCAVVIHPRIFTYNFTVYLDFGSIICSTTAPGAPLSHLLALVPSAPTTADIHGLHFYLPTLFTTETYPILSVLISTKQLENRTQLGPRLKHRVFLSILCHPISWVSPALFNASISHHN